jgi:hypothetical protein
MLHGQTVQLQLTDSRAMSGAAAGSIADSTVHAAGTARVMLNGQWYTISVSIQSAAANSE